MNWVSEDVPSTEVLLGQMAALNWWRGKDSYILYKNPYANDDNQIRRGLGELYERTGVSESIEVNMVGSEPYLLNQEDAKKAFQAYAKVGESYIKGAKMSDITPLVPFMEKYGVPCDLNLDGSNRAFEAIRGITPDSVRAAFASRLFELADGNKWRQISKMAIEEDAFKISFRITTPNGYYQTPTLKTSVPIQNLMPHQWTKLGLEGANALASQRTPVINTMVKMTRYRHQMVLVSNGLLSSIWLAFQISLSNSDGMPELTKTCLSHGNFTGCGRQFVPSSSRDRLCPECKAKAKSEAQARWRAKKANNDRT